MWISKAVACLTVLSSIVASAQHGAAAPEWRVYGGDPGFTRYSPLEQIDASNVAELEIAWEWISSDAQIQARHPENAQIQSANYFQCTPVMVNGVLYGATCLGNAFAIDAGTGETLWNFVTGSYKSGRPPNLGYINRGVAYWKDEIDERVLMITSDSYLFAFDARSGRPIETFGDAGWVDTVDFVPRLHRARGYGHPSGPAVCRDTIIIGSSITDGPTSKTNVPGRVLGFDARSGTFRWAFNLVPQDGEPGVETWEEESWRYTGHANVWAPISVDEKLGYIYVPTSTPSNDFYGGHRKGDDLFAESIVCLNAGTGDRVWHFQTVHHGLWDYDNPAAPILCDIVVEGKSIKALAQVTKQGFVFVLDRVTGEPVWPIEERPVPQSSVPGEQTAPTQPFPTKPPPFEPQGVGIEQLIDYTPELRERAKEILAKYHYGPLYTPPTLEKPTIVMPGWGGGANWPGAAFDPESNTLYVPSMMNATVIQLAQPDPARSDFRYVRSRAELETIEGLDIFKGPYAKITAYDLNRGEIVWETVNGGDGPIDHPLIKGLNLPPMGTKARAGVLATKTLLFATEGSGRSQSATGGGNGLRVLNKSNGAELARIELPDQATGVPMTYIVDGRQYVVVAVGSTPARLVALALPR